MATKNLVPRGHQEGNLGLENRKWLGINAVSGSFSDIKTDNLKNSQNNDLLVAGDGISISYVNNEDGNNGAQYTISSTSSGNSNAQLDRIFAGPNDANGSPTQQQAVIAGFDESNSTLNKLTFKTDGLERWFIDNDGHYIPEGFSGLLDVGNGTNYVKNLYVSSTSSSGKGIRFVSQDSSQISLSVSNKRLIVSSPESNINGNTKYDNILVRKESVKVATHEAIIGQYENNTTITAVGAENLLIDSTQLLLNDRVLVKDQEVSGQNGIYVVTTVGDANTQLVLTRSPDFENDLDFSGVFVECIDGTQNSSKIFYASSGQIGSIVGTNNIIWNDFKSSGLTAIVEDLDPHLGAHLDLNNKNLFDNQSIQLLPNSVAFNQGIELSKNNLKINFTSDTAVTIPTLSLASSASKTINIASVAASSFFSGISSNDFTYTFNPASLTQTEKTNAQAFFATEGWVASQGYVTSVPPAQDLSSYIQSGSIASLQTLTITGENAPSTNVVGISMGSKNIRGLAPPVEDSDAATKQYVDNTIQSVASVLDTCSVATTEDLGATLSGSTLTNNSNGELPSIDSYPISSLSERDSTNPNNIIPGSRILVKDQSNKVENGVYELVSKGSTGTQWSLERTTDFASGFQASGSFIYVEFGDANKGNGFICTSDSNSDTVNTNEIKFVKFSGAGEIGAGAGLSLSGNTLSINVKPAQINDPDNAGSQIDNPNRFIFIDGDDRLDANISNLVTALNTNGGITASSADTFDWPTTAINTISTIDQLVILDKVVAGNDVMKHVSIGSLKSHILSFTTSDIQYLNDTNNPNTLKIKSAAVDNTHLNKSVITGQTILEDNDSNEVKPSADDLILISDNSDNGSLKKVKYSKFLSNITATPDFSGTELLAENDLALNDKVLVLDSDSSNSLHHLPFSRVARKFVTLDSSSGNISLQANNPTILDPGYTYYYKLAVGNSSSTRYVELNSTASEHDTVEIFVLSPKTSLGEDQGNLTDKKLSIKLSDSKTVEYNFSDFPKDNHYIFVYIDGMWITKPKGLDRKVSPLQIIKSAEAFNQMMQGSSLEPLRFKYKNYYISSTAESITLTLPTATSVLNDDDIIPGDSIRVYFMHKNVTKTVTLLTGDESIFHKLVGTNSARANDFLVTKKEISFNIKESADADMPYIDITFKSIFDDNSTNLFLSIKHTGWLISSPYNAANSDPAFSLPTGTQHQILSYDSGGVTVSPGKIKAVNIEDGAITGGVNGTGNNTTAAGPIALSTIVGANIVSNTVTKDKLAQVNNYKVLGSLNNDVNAPENNAVAEVNVIKDLSVNILEVNQHNSIATAQAIKDLIGTQPIVNPIDQILYIGNQNDTDFATFPQRYEIPDSLSSANINLNLFLRNIAIKAHRNTNFREMNDIANLSSNAVFGYQGANGVDNEDTRNFYKLEFKSRSNKPNFDANGNSIPFNDRVNLPWYYNTSDLRLPSSEYWYNTYGPETPVKIKITFTADSSLNVPIGELMNDYESYSARLGLTSAQKNRFRSLWRSEKHYIIKILPNSNDVNAKSDYQGLTTALSDINLKSGTPTYVVDAYTSSSGVASYGTQLFALQDGSDISSQSKVMSYSQGNFIGLSLSNNREERTIKAYVRKYGQTKQRTAAGGSNWPQTSILTIPESYVWHITIE